jgi:hypothetical protein
MRRRYSFTERFEFARDLAPGITLDNERASGLA